MMQQEAASHFNWIGIISDRLICAKQKNNELALLSLSFLENKNFPDFSNIERPQFPISVEQLSNPKFYGVIVSALNSIKKSNFNDNPNDQVQNDSNFSFDTILNDLSNESYHPQKPCDVEGLQNGDIEHHVNLCRSIEYYVLDHAISIDLLTSDLRHLPRSFFVLPSNITIDLLEDAISLWLSKFHCNISFDQEVSFEPNSNIQPNMNEKLYHIQLDTSKFSKVAACLARVFPKEINKKEIKNGDTEEEISNNRKLSCVILNELHAFVPDTFPIDERLFLLFIADLYYATRSGVKRFVKVDQHPLPAFVVHPPESGSSTRPQTTSISIRKPIMPASKPVLQSIQQTKTPQIIKPKILKPKVDNSLLSKQKRQNKMKTEKDKMARKARLPKLDTKVNIEAEPIILGDQIIELAEDEIDESGVVLVDDPNLKDKLDAFGEFENDVNNNGQNKNKSEFDEQNDKSKSSSLEINDEKENRNKKKRNLEFPELELLLKQLIAKHPENEAYYNRLYSTFLRVMEQAMIINYPNISELFNFTKSTFEKLLRNEELDYDFEEIILNMLQKYKKQMDESKVNDLHDINNSNDESLTNQKDRQNDNYIAQIDNQDESQQNNKDKTSIEYVSNQLLNNQTDGDHMQLNDGIGKNGNGDEVQGSQSNNMNQNENGIQTSQTLSGINKNQIDDDIQGNENDNEIHRNKNEDAINENENDDGINRNDNGEGTNGQDEDDINGINNKDNGEDTNGENVDHTNSGNDNDINENENDNSINGNEADNDLHGIENDDVANGQVNDDEINENGNDADINEEGNYDSTNENANNDGISQNETDNCITEKDNDGINEANATDDISVDNDYNNDNDDNVNNNDNDDAINETNGTDDISVDNDSNNDNDYSVNKNYNDEIIDQNSNNDLENDINENDGTNNSDQNDVDTNLEDVSRNLPSDENQANDINEENNEEDNQNSNEEEQITDDMILREAENSVSQKRNRKMKQLSSAFYSKDKSKRANTVPNYQTIINALKFNSMPGPQFKQVLNEIIDLLQDFKEERILLLIASRTQKFKGVYILINEDLSATKLWGTGPNDIKNEDVGTYYKYINGQKSFEQIATKSFTQTTDGFSLKKQLEKKTW